MPTIPSSPPLPTASGTSLRLRPLNRDEERLVRYYRSLSDQDRDAVRCLLYAIREIRRSERPARQETP
jgi:hypothetical protein